MLKKISAITARQKLGQLMNKVNLRNDEFIIERNGKAVAALVPVWMVLKRREQAEEFLNMFNKGKTAVELSDEEAMELALEAVKEVRREKSVD